MNMFEFFFKYRPIVYEKGRLSFQLLSSKWLFIPLALIAIGVAIYFYRRVAKEKLSPWMIVLRSAVFVILLFMVLQPVLNVSQVLPQDSYMAVVIDTSESMNIKDDGETSRSEIDAQEDRGDEIPPGALEEVQGSPLRIQPGSAPYRSDFRTAIQWTANAPRGSDRSSAAGNGHACR